MVAVPAASGGPLSPPLWRCGTVAYTEYFADQMAEPNYAAALAAAFRLA